MDERERERERERDREREERERETWLWCCMCKMYNRWPTERQRDDGKWVSFLSRL